jgi:hypothetical protein
MRTNAEDSLKTRYAAVALTLADTKRLTCVLRAVLLIEAVVHRNCVVLDARDGSDGGADLGLGPTLEDGPAHSRDLFLCDAH